MMGNILIFLAGLAVYSGYGIQGFCYLLGTVVLSYGAGRLIPRFPWVMWISVIANGLLLAAVKFQTAGDTEILPVLGISYFTLKIISYHADLYRGDYLPEKNFLRYALYITYLPQLFLGPIERYTDFSYALENRRISWDGISAGAARILWGAVKKLVVAARISVIVSTISGDTEAYRGAYALAAMVLYYIQLYTDFSGGIDMAIGASQMLGIRISENFRKPWLAESVQEFWRRWHITLGGWLRDYVYIPLGGSRKGYFRKTVNTLVTFLVSGLWHGAHYLLWGLINGALVLLGGRCKTGSRLLNRTGTFLVISFLWAFFVWPDTATALEMIGSVFTTFNYAALFGAITDLGLAPGELLVLACGIAGVWGIETHMEGIGNCFTGRSPAGRVAVLCILALVILVFGMYGMGFEVDAFIYSRF